MKKEVSPVAPVSLQDHLPEEIISTIARIYALHPKLLTNATRRKTQTQTEARCVCAWVLNKCCKQVLFSIQTRLGFHAHSAVLRCIQSVESSAAVDADFRDRLQAILLTLSKNKKPAQD